MIPGALSAVMCIARLPSTGSSFSQPHINSLPPRRVSPMPSACTEFLRFILSSSLCPCKGAQTATSNSGIVVQTRELDIIWNNAFRYIFNCCWRESVKPVQFYGNTVPLSYMIDERKLLFYRKISLSKNVILRTLMCLPEVSSDFMFLCSKYGVRSTATRDSIKGAVTVTHAFAASLAAYL